MNELNTTPEEKQATQVANTNQKVVFLNIESARPEDIERFKEECSGHGIVVIVIPFGASIEVMHT